MLVPELTQGNCMDCSNATLVEQGWDCCWPQAADITLSQDACAMREQQSLKCASDTREGTCLWHPLPHLVHILLSYVCWRPRLRLQDAEQLGQQWRKLSVLPCTASSDGSMGHLRPPPLHNHEYSAGSDERKGIIEPHITGQSLLFANESAVGF